MLMRINKTKLRTNTQIRDKSHAPTSNGHLSRVTSSLKVKISLPYGFVIKIENQVQSACNSHMSININVDKAYHFEI